MNRLAATLCAVILFGSLNFSMAFSQTVRIEGGSGNVAIGNQNAPVNVFPPSISIEPSPATQNVADSLGKIVRFLEASNPTKIQLGDVRLINWLGTNEKILTLDLENSSNMPGYKVKTMLVAPLDVGKAQSRTLLMKPGRGFSKDTLDMLSVEAHGTQSIPIATVSELKRFLHFPEGYDLIGAGLAANVPDTLIAEYANRRKRAVGSAGTDARSVGFIVQTAYHTVFGGKGVASRGAFLYFAQPIKPPVIMILPSGRAP